MTGYRKSWGEIMNRLIEQRGKEKNEDFFLVECKGNQELFEYVLECEINELPRAEFVDLLESAGVLCLPAPEPKVTPLHTAETIEQIQAVINTAQELLAPLREKYKAELLEKRKENPYYPYSSLGEHIA